MNGATPVLDRKISSPHNRNTTTIGNSHHFLTNYHHLNNLVWIWSVDRPGTNASPFAEFFPGKNYFDIAALDVYRNDFQKTYYDDLLKLAAGKPVALAEVGPAPTPAILKQQPKWTWWMLWAMGGRGMARTNGPSVMQALVNNPRSLSRDDPEFRKGITPLRAASGLAPLPLPSASRPAQN